jgi:hypothetical protein
MRKLTPAALDKATIKACVRIAENAKKNKTGPTVREAVCTEIADAIQALATSQPEQHLREACLVPRDPNCGQHLVAVGSGHGAGPLNIYRCDNCGSESWT